MSQGASEALLRGYALNGAGTEEASGRWLFFCRGEREKKHVFWCLLLFFGRLYCFFFFLRTVCVCVCVWTGPCLNTFLETGQVSPNLKISSGMKMLLSFSGLNHRWLAAP